MPTTRDAELAREQAYVDTLYSRLDEVREITRRQLRQVLLEAGTGTPQSVVERDVFAATHAERLARLEAAETGLCFGAMDHVDGRRTYIGRIGLSDSEQEPILVDWRAPVATAFYQATIADPRGLVRRRHLRTKGREVVGIADDPLDPRAAQAAGGAGAVLSGDTMLLEALSAPRTGRMHDIIATLQAEQDRIIRAPANGVLVVDGGPGTGKTAVALHRAAYLLYADRDRLAQSGVLVVGPSPTFLRYIEQVLPSLGETGVVFATPGRLLPGIDADGGPDGPAGAREDPAVAALKGDARMAEVIAAAVRDRQRVPRRDVEITHGEYSLRLTRDLVSRARTRARRSRRPHNAARRVFARELLNSLTDQVVAQLRGGLFDAEERAELTADLWADPAVRKVVDDLWPLLTPEQLLTDLYTSPERLARAAGTRLTPAEQALLLRPGARQGSAHRDKDRQGGTGQDVQGMQGTLFADDDMASSPAPPSGAPGASPPEGGGPRWTPADVPLLDEAAELLGDPDEEARIEAERRAAAEREAEREYAREVLEMLGLHDQVDPDSLAGRWSGPRRRRSAAEHAREDRTWTFGHLIVDEAQEVSPMLWRLLWRRCPGRTATLVGDLAQAARPDAPRTWAELLGPAAGDRFTVERLSVNYRTPQEIMDVAADVLAASHPELSPPTSVRSVGRRPRAVRAAGPGQALVDETIRLALDAAAEVGEGRVAVICPPELAADIRAALVTAAPELALPLTGAALSLPSGSGPAGQAVAAGSADPSSAAAGQPGWDLGGAALDARVAVLTVAESKGLEFDAVVLVEPAAMLAGRPRGLADLYVALTRATHTLTVVHSGDLPAVLSRLEGRLEGRLEDRRDGGA